MEPHSSVAVPHLEAALAEASVTTGVVVFWSFGAAAFAVGSALAFQGTPAAGIGLALLAGATTLRALVLGRRRVRATSDGLHVRGLFGESTLRFKDVETVKFDAAAQGDVDFNSSMQFSGGGTTVSMRWLKSGPAGAIGRYAASHVVPRLVDDAAKTLLAGKTITVSKVTLSRAGFKQKNKEIGWHEIDRIDRSPVGLRIFAVDRPGDVITIALNAAQAPLLFALADAMAERTQAGARRQIVVDGFAPHDPRLGKIVAGRPRLRTREQRAGVFGAVATAAGIAVAAVAINHGDTEVAIGAGVVGVTVALISAAVAVAARRHGIAIYDNGMTDGRASIAFDEATSFTRSLVDQYVNGAYTGRLTSVVVKSATSTLRFGGNGDEAEALSDVVMKRVVPAMVARMLKVLAQTGEVKVGAVTFTKQTVSVKKKSMRFDEIVHLEAQQGFLHLWSDVKKKSAVSFSLAGENGWVAAELVSALLRADNEPVAVPAPAEEPAIS